MSEENIDTESELNEAVFIAGTCGSGKTDSIREYASKMNRVRFLDILTNATIVEEEFCRRSGNRCIAQSKLYEIYFKPDGVSLEDSRLFQLEEYRPIVDLWTLHDHNEATKILKICKGNMEEFKAFLPTMHSHVSHYTLNSPENIRNHYKRIIDYYEATGFLEELSTCI